MFALWYSALNGRTSIVEVFYSRAEADAALTMFLEHPKRPEGIFYVNKF